MKMASSAAAQVRENRRDVSLVRSGGVWTGRFQAMASPCEVLCDAPESAVARQVLLRVAREAWRIEDKFSRYAQGNIVHAVNTSCGKPVSVDEETGRLLDFAQKLHQLSDGAFDITSGVLRRVWTFDGSDRLPSTEQVHRVLPLVGWSKVEWNAPEIRLRPGMEIDFGGIGKEYAVDCCARIAAQQWAGSTLVNFGGDLAITRPRASGEPWRVGIEAADSGEADRVVYLGSGGLATSGDSKRYLERDGERYSHILDPRTGWSVRDAAHSVTVAADTCTEAGMLATLAILRGQRAEQFLDRQSVKHWCRR